jgi:exoribonuclease-2
MSPPTTACSATKRASSACRWSPTCATTTSSRCSTPGRWPPAWTEFPFRDELKLLWEFAQVLEAGTRQTLRQCNAQGLQLCRRLGGRQRHCRRTGQRPRQHRGTPRGSPLDTLVAELMIMANATWGAMLRDAGIPALYRVQTAGKVRMSTVAAAHEGLGVDCYAWSSSPLRRYCDLLNQWQLLARC